MPTNLRRLILFAHFDPGCMVDDHVLKLLAALRPWCNDMRFVSGCDLPPEQLHRASPWCSQATVRTTPGYDFASWKLAWQDINPSDWDEIVIANDSVYGPLRPLDKVWSTLANSQDDLWGISTNHLYHPHIQSYFVVFRRAALDHPMIHDFWRNVGSETDRDTVIQKYEVGLGRVAHAARLTMGCMIAPRPKGLLLRLEQGDWRHMCRARLDPFRLPTWRKELLNPLALTKALAKRCAVLPNIARTPSPPTQNEPSTTAVYGSAPYEHWRDSIKIHGVPFLKISVLRNRLFNCTPKAVSSLASAGGYDFRLIEKHLNRTQACQAPTAKSTP